MLDGKAKEYHDGEVIFEEGANGSEMYFIESGRVRLMKRSQGLLVRLATLERGDFFAEKSMLDGCPHCATAIAEGEVSLLACGKEDLVEAIRKNPELALRMMGTLSDRLRKVDKDMAVLAVSGQIPRHLSDAITRRLHGEKDGS
ncbi:MAG: cyclic nucleotide-binding domain-containing protein [Actinobacteria bacterium]|nr:MAG: cyclic nucleotide-binding domain-containing protein [Actinomycetota bacterium]